MTGSFINNAAAYDKQRNDTLMNSIKCNLQYIYAPAEQNITQSYRTVKWINFVVAFAIKISK